MHIYNTPNRPNGYKPFSSTDPEDANCKVWSIYFDEVIVVLVKLLKCKKLVARQLFQVSFGNGKSTSNLSIEFFTHKILISTVHMYQGPCIWLL